MFQKRKKWAFWHKKIVATFSVLASVCQLYETRVLSPKKSVSKLRHAISVVTPKKDRFVTVLNSRVITIFFMGYWHIFCVISFINGRFDTTQNTGRTISIMVSESVCELWIFKIIIERLHNLLVFNDIIYFHQSYRTVK